MSSAGAVVGTLAIVLIMMLIATLSAWTNAVDCAEHGRRMVVTQSSSHCEVP